MKFQELVVTTKIFQKASADLQVISNANLHSGIETVSEVVEHLMSDEIREKRKLFFIVSGY